MKSLNQSSDEKPGEASGRREPMRSLLTIRIIGLLDLLRRSGALANRREFALTGIEWRIMAQVGEHAPLSLNKLAELLGLDRGQLSRAVKAMVERGLLDRKRTPGGPAIVISLTEEGKALQSRMVDLAVARNQFLVGNIPNEEIEQFARLLDVVTRNAQLLLQHEREIGGQQSDETD